MSTEAVWRRLGKLLNSDGEVQDVEIIPGTGEEWRAQYPEHQHQPFLLFDGHLGVPQKILYHAFSEISHLYSSFRWLDTVDVAEALLASSVVLLINADHSSALNLRKRMVSSGLLDPSAELAKTKLLLMIPKNSKSSVLWHHRRWILERLFPDRVARAADIGWCPDLSLAVCQEELSIVSRACETYPRNYHAWAHRSYLLKVMRQQCFTGDSSRWKKLLIHEGQTLKAWIDAHISDYSAVQYLCRVELVIAEAEPSSESLNSARPSVSGILDREMEFLVDLLCRYPEREALWLGVRGSLACLSVTGSASKQAVTRLGDDLLRKLSTASSTATPIQTNLYALRLWFWCLVNDNKAAFTAESVRAVLSGTRAPATEQQTHLLLRSGEKLQG